MRNLAVTMLVAAGLAMNGAAARAEPAVVVSIKPLHSLVASVMAGIGEPELVVSGAFSPHTYSLRPSQAIALQRAEVIFWIGRELEAFLEGPIETIASQARSVELIDADGLTTLAFRQGGVFETIDPDHEDGGHGDEHAQDEHAHDDHAHDGVDSHIWLDPANARAIVRRIAEVLAEIDPDNAARYEANAAALLDRLQALETDTAAMLQTVQDRPFIVFHDGYQYFERRFGLKATGSITVNPELAPGADRIRTLRERIEAAEVTCVFAEPQFDPKLVAVITEGTGAKASVIDPLGAEIEDGPELYFDLISGMAAAFRDCLSANR